MILATKQCGKSLDDLNCFRSERSALCFHLIRCTFCQGSILWNHECCTVILLSSKDKEIKTVIVECDTLSNDSPAGWLSSLHNEHSLIRCSIIMLNIRNLCTLISILIQICLNWLLRLVGFGEALSHLCNLGVITHFISPPAFCSCSNSQCDLSESRCCHTDRN